MLKSKMRELKDIKGMVKDKKVRFTYYRDGNMYYKTEDGFEFPVPLNDVGTASLNAEDKAILFMRWIRKHIQTIQVECPNGKEADC